MRTGGSDPSTNRLSSIQSLQISAESQNNKQQRYSNASKRSDDLESQNRGDSEISGSVGGEVSQSTLIATSQSEGSDTDSSGGNFGKEQAVNRDIYQAKTTNEEQPFTEEQNALTEAYKLLGKELPPDKPAMDILDF